MTDNRNSDRYDLFVDLFSRNAKRIYGCIYSMLAHWEDADDVFQETSRVLWEKFSEFEPGTNFFAWAKRIACFQVLAFRQKKRRSHVQFTDAFLDVVANATETNNERLETEQRALTHCIEQLKPREREIVLLRFAPGATTKTVAERLGMTTDAIYKAISRAQSALLKCVEGVVVERERR
jgi:RNA polymerase sigma-70 factor (ECF subfamily)